MSGRGSVFGTSLCWHSRPVPVVSSRFVSRCKLKAVHCGVRIIRGLGTFIRGAARGQKVVRTYGTRCCEVAVVVRFRGPSRPSRVFVLCALNRGFVELLPALQRHQAHTQRRGKDRLFLALLFL